MPILGDAVVLSATTISGTVVMGLGPPMFFSMFIGPGTKRMAYQLPVAFNASFWCGVTMGILIQCGVAPSAFKIGTGTYALLLGYNLYGLLLCFGFYLLGLALHAFVLPKRFVNVDEVVGKVYYHGDDQTSDNDSQHNNNESASPHENQVADKPPLDSDPLNDQVDEITII